MSRARAYNADYWCNGDGAEFEDLLSEAEFGATTGTAQDFVADMKAKWSQHGLRMYLSEAQYNYLKRLAKQA